MPNEPSEPDIDGTHGDILPYVDVELLERQECSDFYFPRFACFQARRGQ